MSDLYPLRLHPEFYERVWGARSLAPIYSREITGNPVGEVWLTGEECKVANGPLKGNSLADLSRKFGAQLIGEAAFPHSRFPLLVKFLFPKDKLSVQVHPDDESSARTGQENGKTQINLVSSPCFVVDKFTLSKAWEFRRPRHAKRSVWCLVAIRGSGVVMAEGAEPVNFNSGEVVVVPAAVEKFTLKPQWEL